VFLDAQTDDHHVPDRYDSGELWIRSQRVSTFFWGHSVLEYDELLWIVQDRTISGCWENSNEFSSSVKGNEFHY
jgi:hypothetical protein